MGIKSLEKGHPVLRRLGVITCPKAECIRTIHVSCMPSLYPMNHVWGKIWLPLNSIVTIKDWKTKNNLPS